jgi:hypothetical protein
VFVHRLGITQVEIRYAVQFSIKKADTHYSHGQIGLIPKIIIEIEGLVIQTMSERNMRINEFFFKYESRKDLTTS